MGFIVTGILLDACVLGALSDSPAYGYELTQRTQIQLGISETALYPVLRRLLKEECLLFYDEPYDGRNRRYYKLTDKGLEVLCTYKSDWLLHKKNIDYFLAESMQVVSDEQSSVHEKESENGGNSHE